ncbi:MAG: class I tRNA ligase family protein [Candidatus Bathyarchaeia archaeon]
MGGAWPYIHGIPHIGNLISSELSADIYARYLRLRGEDLVFVSGSDEHGTPIEVEAAKQGVEPKTLTDKFHAKVVEIFKNFGSHSTTTPGPTTPRIYLSARTSSNESTRMVT